MMAQGQTSFIVADKNGNSQLVQSLSFQKEQYGDRTSSGFRYIWKGDGTKRGIIEDLGYIARTNSTLATGSVDDVTTMLEQISGSNQADAEAIAGMLTENANVEEALSSSDGQSLIIKYKDTDVYSVYPISLLQDPFDDDANEASQARSYASNRTASAQFRTTGTKGKVAVFNYFSNQVMTRKTQNKMLEYMMYDLNNHGYGVEYYPYEEMTVANIKNVIAYSSDYTAVIIMSHGFSTNNHSYFAIGEAYDRCNYDAKVKLFVEDEASENNKVPFIARFWNEGFGIFGTGARYDCAVNVNKMSFDNNVILYMGSCDAYNKGSNKHGTCVGWSGSNSTAQAHATLLFYNLMRGKTFADAIDVKNEEDYYYSITKGQPDTWSTDPQTNARMSYQLQGMFRFNPDIDPPLFTPVTQYYRAGRCFLVTVPSGYNGPIFTSDKKVKIRFYMRDDFGGSVPYPEKIYIKATPLRSDESSKTYPTKLVNISGTYEEVEVKIPENGIYVITAATDEAFSKEILFRKPLIFVKAKPFKENSGEGEVFYNTCPDNNHPHAIDLGLPSGTLWACCNVGAKIPEECGNYYAWGDTKEAVERVVNNVFDDYVHCDGSANTCHDLGASICGTKYDVAHIKWGGNWRMPTIEEYRELREKCTLMMEGYDSDGKKGLQVIGPNNNSIFLPAGGEGFISVGQYGRYWTGTQHEEYLYAAYKFEFFYMYADYAHDWGLRGDEYNIRPVINTAK